MIFRPDLILIDGTSYIYRAFHALPPLTTSSGKPTGATRGFASMLRKLIEKYPSIPMVMVFDAKGPNFRNDYYQAYKANRPPMPNELRVQIEDIKKLSKLFNFTVKEESGVEADDVIATLTKQFKENKKILISSPDKDLTQLVEHNVIQHNSMSNEFESKDIFSYHHRSYLLPSFLSTIFHKFQYFDNVACYYKYNYFQRLYCYRYQKLLKILYLVILYI